jgi:hypothetical protein
MKINFTKKEYRSLVELLEMASWITSSHKIDTDSFPEKYVDLTQKMYSFYKEMGCSDIIEKSKVGDEFYPTRDFEEDSVVRQFIDEFEEDTFWAELVSRLSERDVLDKHNIESLSELETSERIEALFLEDEKWDAEFNQFGINRLGVVALKLVK